MSYTKLSISLLFSNNNNILHLYHLISNKLLFYFFNIIILFSNLNFSFQYSKCQLSVKFKLFC